jgi:hypothetical protein
MSDDIAGGLRQIAVNDEAKRNGLKGNDHNHHRE